jgi:hypothetical protein
MLQDGFEECMKDNKVDCLRPILTCYGGLFGVSRGLVCHVDGELRTGFALKINDAESFLLFGLVRRSTAPPVSESLAADFAERPHRAGGLAEIKMVTFGLDVHRAAEDGGKIVQRSTAAYRRAQIDLVIAEQA